TLSGRKETFKSIEPGKARMYTCGPTVYDYAHIGNLSAYIYADTLRRHLEYSGYEVRQIVNITDVGHLTADDLNQADSGQDKMLKASLREKKTPEEIARYYTKCFFADVKKLNIEKAHYYPRATAHIPQMIKMMEALFEKGLAYEKNGNVFYDVTKFKEYGKLSKKKIDELRCGARLDDHPDKKHSYDFALWLKAPKKHLLKWKSPWSFGYPGWHIECSAMAIEYLGETLDIHSGGEDHIFPHHENEIAQSEGVTGKPFSNLWFHNRFLLVNGKKMSKSENNFYTLKDITDKKYDPMVFRLLVLGSHYRSNLNFTWKRMDEARKNYEKITRFIKKLTEISSLSLSTEGGKNVDLTRFLQEFEDAMNNDLNTPLALSVFYDLISKMNKNIIDQKLAPEKAREILAILEKMNKVFGMKIELKTRSIPKVIFDLLKKREQARSKKKYKEADKIRLEIENKGFIVEDTPDGQKVRIKELLPS
ncbi:MAG: cysteine--tRNA ligase, partial [Patescibacteria group bacterium]|nr:cysteine--tRNA ligase [Patescibacteria group bacterium]